MTPNGGPTSSTFLNSHSFKRYALFGAEICAQNTGFWERSFCTDVSIYKSFHMTWNWYTFKILLPTLMYDTPYCTYIYVCCVSNMMHIWDSLVTHASWFRCAGWWDARVGNKILKVYQIQVIWKLLYIETSV